ncbi:hypothetical protein GMDG_02368 [Pseudogymnoascus destructans 20631-21]|uniref:Uncharacterized protein n=1 Tax=Pseudogymnoascus destructans (strain ATCC MYA-4855 / 20631-21) TaxID=658429 RepID=L8G2T4_PSED2|nr:hypothetical protein GMDG_02368 [Pseudogymnoascus destructans 20631-21]
MGRTSKFFFPVPGRRASVLPPAKTESIPTTSSSSNSRPPQQRQQQPLSKAQRLLGTGNLNIDSPSREDDGTWRSYTPSSTTRSRAATSPSRMSIEIAESTTEDNAFSASEGGGVPPIRLDCKASPTLLGRGAVMRGDYGGGEDMASDLPDIRLERSNSTLRSYYDRGSTPLAVSQQTSASSARDLALRKGYQPVVSNMLHSPLSPHGIDSIAKDDGDDDVTTHNRDRGSYFPSSPMQPPKKKTSRLDLTRLFHKKSKDAQSLRPPSVASGISSSSATDAAYARKLGNNPPIVRQKSAVVSPPVDRLRDEKTVQFQSDHHATDDLWDHYEQRVYADRSPAPVPEPRAAVAAKVPVITAPRPRHEAPNGVAYPDLRPRNKHDGRDTAPPPSAHAAWRARDHLGAGGGGGGQNWDATSRVSDSSKTTGTSRRSVFSNSNLQQNSILSLSESSSSDDEERGDDKDTFESDGMGNGARRAGERNTARSQTNGGTTHKSSSSTTSSSAKKQSSSSKIRQKPKPLRNLDAFPRPASSTSHPSLNTPSPHHSNFLTIPSPISPHLSGPWRSSASSPPTTAIPPPGGALPGVPQGVRRQPSSASKASTMRSVNSSRTASTLRSTAPRSRPLVEGLPSPVSPMSPGHERQGSEGTGYSNGFNGYTNGYSNGNGYANGNGNGYTNGHNTHLPIGSATSTHTSSRSPNPSYAVPAVPTSATAAAANLMAVTPQEQALLSALRRKRARMRDKILAEGSLDVGTASVVTIGGGGGGGGGAGRNLGGGSGLMLRGSVRSGMSNSSTVSGESVVFCLDNNNGGPVTNGAGGQKSVRSARSVRSERSDRERFGGVGMRGESGRGNGNGRENGRGRGRGNGREKERVSWVLLRDGR